MLYEVITHPRIRRTDPVGLPVRRGKRPADDVAAVIEDLPESFADEDRMDEASDQSHGEGVLHLVGDDRPVVTGAEGVHVMPERIP